MPDNDPIPTPPEGEPSLEDALDWTALEEGLPDPDSVLHDDDYARHTMLGVLTAAGSIGLRKQVWEHLEASIPKWGETFTGIGERDLPDPDSLEFARMNDLVIDACSIAEGWLRDWLTTHGVPYLHAPVMCPAHGIFMYLIAGDPVVMAEDFGTDFVEGLNPIMTSG